MNVIAEIRLLVQRAAEALTPTSVTVPYLAQVTLHSCVEADIGFLSTTSKLPHNPPGHTMAAFTNLPADAH